MLPVGEPCCDPSFPSPQPSPGYVTAAVRAQQCVRSSARAAVRAQQCVRCSAYAAGNAQQYVRSSVVRHFINVDEYFTSVAKSFHYFHVLVLQISSVSSIFSSILHRWDARDSLSVFLHIPRVFHMVSRAPSGMFRINISG